MVRKGTRRRTIPKVRLSPPFGSIHPDDQVLDELIDDSENEPGPQPSASWDTLFNRRDDALDDFLTSIYQRTQRAAVGRGALNNCEAHNQIAGLPSLEDYPLWRVGCRVCSVFIRWNNNLICKFIRSVLRRMLSLASCKGQTKGINSVLPLREGQFAAGSIWNAL